MFVFFRRGTPVRLRSDIRSTRKLKQVNVGGGSEPPVCLIFFVVKREIMVSILS